MPNMWYSHPDAEGRQKGHDSILCEDSCQGRLHRTCAGFTKAAFQADPSSDYFICRCCRTTEQDKEVQQLKNRITQLEQELANQSTVVWADLYQGATTVASRTYSVYAKVVRETQLESQDAHKSDQDGQNRASNQERKFNVVVYGINECQKGTSRQETWTNKQRSRRE